MPNETAITRLLYAMLCQKDLRDIDWDKVAADPFLSQQITNGHAARMRYSRFRKQMEGNEPIPRKSRNKNKIEKKKSPSQREKEKRRQKREEDEARINSQFYENEYSSTNNTPDLEDGMIRGVNGRMKSEAASSSHNMTPMPTTPLNPFSTPGSYPRFHQEYSMSPSPGTSFGHASGHLDEMGDVIATSFGMPGGMSPGGGGYFHAEIGNAQDYGLGMGQMGMGLDDSYDGSFWEDRVGENSSFGERVSIHGRGDGGGGSRTLVKSEPRWENGYSRSP